MRLLFSLITAVALSTAAAVSYVRGEEPMAHAGAVAATSGWARATPPGATVGAAYVTIRNEGGTADRLIGVETPVAGMVTLHETAEAGGVAQMRPVEGGIAVPAGATVAMRPGGLHLMLMDLRAPLKAGETVPLTLVFESAGKMALPVRVEPAGSPGPANTTHPAH